MSVSSIDPVEQDVNGEKGLYQLEMRPASGCTLNKFKKRGNIHDQDPGHTSIDTLETKVSHEAAQFRLILLSVLEIDPQPRSLIWRRSGPVLI